VRIGDRQALLVLVKNLSGSNEGLRLVLTGDGQVNMLLGLNENGPDGRDVSGSGTLTSRGVRDRAATLGVHSRG
jgi:hypothetical protein